MVDEGLFDQYSEALTRLSASAYVALRLLLEKCSNVPDSQLGEVLANWYPALAAEYGDAAASAAKDFYEKQRDASGADGPYEPTLAEQVPRSYAVSDLSDALSTSAGAPDRSAIAANLGQAMVKTSMQRADRTIVMNAQRDPAHPRWALVPHVGACGYCVMLGSLGFFYSSDQGAMAARHRGCTCVPVADFDVKNPRLKDYHPEAMREAYAKCAKAVSGDWQRRWEALGHEGQLEYAKTHHRKGAKPNIEQARDHFHQRAIVDEMNRRDREWMRTGKKLELGYDSEETLAKKTANKTERENHALELRTASKLRKNGYATEFWDDEIVMEDGSVLGRADLSSGIEIKTVYTASSANTIGKHLANCKNKDGLTAIVVDVSENQNMTDEFARDAIRKNMWKSGKDFVLLINHAEEVEVLTK